MQNKSLPSVTPTSERTSCALLRGRRQQAAYSWCWVLNASTFPGRSRFKGTQQVPECSKAANSLRLTGVLNCTNGLQVGTISIPQHHHHLQTPTWHSILGLLYQECLFSS